MQEFLLRTLISALLGMLTEKNMRTLIDWILDFAEDAAMNSENKYDDVIILGLCGKIRTVFGVPDNDPVKVAVIASPEVEVAEVPETVSEDVLSNPIEDFEDPKTPTEPHVYQDEDSATIEVD